MLVSMDISVPALLPPSLSRYHSLHRITYHIGTVITISHQDDTYLAPTLS